MGSELERAFAGRVRGRLATDRITRQLYATDASPYQVVPAAVFVPAVADDVPAALEVCRELGMPVTPRGAGTSLSGQCVGDGLQLDFSALAGIRWLDAERRLVSVEPGMTWWRLDAELARHGLEFGPDPATKRQCTIGGMVGTNAGGTHSLVYGASVDHVHAVEALLADGRHVRLEASRDGTVQSGGAPENLAAAVEDVRRRASPLLGTSFRTLARRGSGYQLEHLCADRPHLGKLLAGSDGTLALLTGVELELGPRPAARVLGVAAFDDMHAAIAAVPALVETSPSAVELVSRSLVDVARKDPFHARTVAGVDPEAGALLYVEYQGGSRGEAESGFAGMDAALRGCAGLGEVARFTDPRATAAMWAIREAGVGALSAVAGGPRLPQAFVEDTIVAVDRLPGYIRALDELFARHGMDVVWYGHASTGLIHVRPFLDLSDRRDLVRLREMMSDVVDLVVAWGGDLCGEHGDGFARTYWNEKLFGPELYAQMRALKHAFDPTGKLNPGKVVDGPPPTDNLRFAPGHHHRPLDVRISFTDQGGIGPAAERCFGAGVCRKRDIGTMCPPAQVTGMEEHSTRARANLLRSVVGGDLALEDLDSAQAREVMETCVGCKACKVECPARVDLARMKIAWTDLHRRRNGGTLLGAAIANLRTLSRLGAPVAPVANATLRSSWLKRRLGVAAERSIPPFVRRPLTRRLRIGGDVALFADCFATYQEPEIGEYLRDLLAAAGLRLGRAPAGCCGRVMLSEGYVDKARRVARRTAAALREIPVPILFSEPSCLSAVTDDWPHLIGDVSDVVSRCRPAEDYLTEMPERLSFRGGGRALVHPHCHHRALWGTDGIESALRLVPDLIVEVVDSGCCGMAGAFGYRSNRYELSVAMAERALLPAVRDAPGAEVVATGTSCRHQIRELSGREAVHPVTFLRRRMLS